LAVAAAERKATAKDAKTKTTAAKSAPRQVVVPAGAEEISPGEWRHTDAGGKRWIYRQTPFGIARIEDKASPEADRQAAESEAAQLAATTAVEDGDVIRFTRPGPFGLYRWTKKKSELNEQERAVWKREQERAAKAAGKPE
jgi:hypothetical protein